MASSVIKSGNLLDSNVVSANNNQIQYVYGRYNVKQTTVLGRVQDFINAIDTRNMYTVFDVLVQKSGVYHVHGFVFADKSNGGAVIDYYAGGKIYGWQRDNGSDALITLS